MSELELLQKVLSPAPPRAEAERDGRAKLMEAMEKPRPQGVPILAGTRARHRRAWRYAAAAVAAGVAAGIAVAAVSTGGPSHPARSVGRRPVVVKLASYRLTLPRGFALDAASCLATPSPGIGPETVPASLQAAASADGGCLELLIAAGGVVVPPGATQVSVGSQIGYYVAGTDGTETLFVAIPAAQGDHYLVLSASGLTESQLIAIGASAFPS